MQQLHFWKDTRFLLLSFGGTIVLGVMGFIILPEMEQYLQTHINKQLLLNACFFIGFLLLSLLLLSEITFRVGQLWQMSIYKKRSQYYRRILSFCLVVLAIYLAVGLLSGGISVLIHRIFIDDFGFSEKKLAIDLILSELPILVMPVIVMQLLTFSFSNAKFIKTVKIGFLCLKGVYLKLLLATIGLFLLGFSITLPFSYLSSIWPQRIGLTLAFGVLGVVAVIVVYSIGLKRFQDIRGRKSA